MPDGLSAARVGVSASGAAAPYADGIARLSASLRCTAPGASPKWHFSRSRLAPPALATADDELKALSSSSHALSLLHSIMRDAFPDDGRWGVTGFDTLWPDLIANATAAMAQAAPMREAAVSMTSVPVASAPSASASDASLSKTMPSDASSPALVSDGRHARVCGLLLPVLPALAASRHAGVEEQKVRTGPRLACDANTTTPTAAELTVSPREKERATGSLSDARRERVASVLQQFGAVLIPAIVDDKLVSELRGELLRPTATRERPQQNIREPEHREHLLLHPYAEPNVSALLRALGVQQGEDGVARGPLAALVPRAAPLVELAAIVVKRGAKAQEAHSDTYSRHADGRVVTAFVALQRTFAEGAALRVAPRSHRLTYGGECVDPRSQRLRARGRLSEVVLPAPSGSIVLMDSRTHHRAGAHRRKNARVVMYLSWGEPESLAPYLPGGTNYALRPELWGSTMPLPPTATSPPLERQASWGLDEWVSIQMQNCIGESSQWLEQWHCLLATVIFHVLQFKEYSRSKLGAPHYLDANVVWYGRRVERRTRGDRNSLARTEDPNTG